MRINPFNDHANVFVNPYDNVLNKLRQQKLNESENYYKNKYNNLNKKLNVLTKYLEEASGSAYSADGRGVGSPMMGMSTSSDPYAMLGGFIPPTLFKNIPKELLDDLIRGFRNILGDNLQQADDALDGVWRNAPDNNVPGGGRIFTVPVNRMPSGYTNVKGIGMVPRPPAGHRTLKQFPPTRGTNFIGPGQALPPGVYYDPATGYFWTISAPSIDYPQGVVHYFNPAMGDSGWQVFRGPGFQNPWGFDGIGYNGGGSGSIGPPPPRDDGPGWQVSM